VHDERAARGRAHRLFARRAQVDDRKTLVGKADVQAAEALYRAVLSIRAPMPLQLFGAREDGRVWSRGRGDAEDSAHVD
jgi:hypothetical protein